MTDAREEILSRLTKAGTALPPRVTRVSPPPMPDDPLAVLETRLAQNGGVLVANAAAADWPTRIGLPTPVGEFEHIHCPDALARPGHDVTHRGVARTATDVHDLAPLDLCVLLGEFAVVENGAAWHVPCSPFERAAALLAQHLVVVVPANALVSSLHDAYARIALGETRFGWFLTGPSKTADIEQALVLGAHGPRSMHLVLLRD